MVLRGSWSEGVRAQFVYKFAGAYGGPSGWILLGVNKTEERNASNGEAKTFTHAVSFSVR